MPDRDPTRDQASSFPFIFDEPGEGRVIHRVMDRRNPIQTLY
jgi:hypothetical protein